MCGNGREGGEVAYSGIGSRISLTLVEFQLHLSLKSDCRRDPQSLCSPSPILMKLAQVVRLGLKRSLVTPFWPIRPVRPAQGPPKRPFLGFLKNGFLDIFPCSQSVQICLLWVFGRFLSPKCPVFQILELS